MPVVHHKPPELVQAQIADYASETAPTEREKNIIMQNVVALASGESQEPAYREHFVNYLRGVGGSKHEPISRRAALLLNFRDFEPEVEQLKEEISDPVDLINHPELLGAGVSSHAFAIQKDGKTYVVRVPAMGRVKPDTIERHLGVAIKTQGMSHVEQIVAASYETGVTVAELMPGKTVGELTPDEMEAITPEQLAQLIRTVTQLQERGLVIDLNAGNILYDPVEGFGIIDIQEPLIGAPKRNDTQELGIRLRTVIAIIMTSGRTSDASLDSTGLAKYSVELDYAKARLRALMLLRQVGRSQSSGKEKRLFKKNIKTSIDECQEIIQKYSDPNSVAQDIASRREAEIFKRNQFDIKVDDDGTVHIDDTVTY